MLQPLIRHADVVGPEFLEDEPHLVCAFTGTGKNIFQKNIFPSLRAAGVHPDEGDPLLVRARLGAADVGHETGDTRIGSIAEFTRRCRYSRPRGGGDFGVLA